jgi:hypothetical protein
MHEDDRDLIFIMIFVWKHILNCVSLKLKSLSWIVMKNFNTCENCIMFLKASLNISKVHNQCGIHTHTHTHIIWNMYLAC